MEPGGGKGEMNSDTRGNGSGLRHCPFGEPGGGKGEMKSDTRGNASGLRHCPFGNSVSGSIINGAAAQLAHQWATGGDFRGMFIVSTCHFWRNSCSANSTRSSTLGDFVAIQSVEGLKL